jgi:hypothetical protein
MPDTPPHSKKKPSPFQGSTWMLHAEETIEVAQHRFQADKGDDSEAIPPRQNRVETRFYDKALYQERHKIGCLFGLMKHGRRLRC